MLPEELEQVFGSVTQLYSRNLSDAFRRLPPQVCRANQIPECSCLSRMHEIAVQESNHAGLDACQSAHQAI